MDPASRKKIPSALHTLLVNDLASLLSRPIRTISNYSKNLNPYPGVLIAA